jgi:hypothetical protein
MRISEDQKLVSDYPKLMGRTTLEKGYYQLSEHFGSVNSEHIENFHTEMMKVDDYKTDKPVMT